MTGFAGISTGAGIRASRTSVSIEQDLVWFHGFLAGVGSAPGIAESMIAGAYRRYGAGFQQQLTGEYAYALFDTGKRTWVIGHDALGLRSMFIARQKDGIAFASHLERLLSLTSIGTLDEEYIADLFACGAHFGSRTPFAGHERIAPGEALVVERSGTWRRIVTHAPQDIAVRNVPHDEAVARLRELIRDAVLGCLPDAGVFLSELSGGLDSSTVSCLAAELAPSRCQFLSTVFSETPKADETNWMGVVREQHPLPWHAIDANQCPPFSDLPNRFQAEPSRALLLTAYYRQIDTVVSAQQASAILTGHGGDSVFFGDSPEPYFLADLLPRQPGELLRSLATWRSRSPLRRPFAYWLSRYALGPRLRRQFGGRVLRATRDGKPVSWIEPNHARRMDLKERGRRSFLPAAHGVQSAYFWERIRTSAFWLTTDIYQRPDAPDYRSPLLALPLVEFMAALPWREQLCPDGDRPLQREAMTGVLPEQTRLRRGKRGSDAAFYHGLRKSEAWLALLSERPEIVERGYVDLVRWREAIEKARFGFVEDIGTFLSCCALEVWLRGLETARLPTVDWIEVESGLKPPRTEPQHARQ